MRGLLSELEAVNRLLAVAGDSPVQTLEDDYVQAKLARQVLESTSRTIQGKGWWFNEEENVELLPTSTGLIVLGPNVISAIPTNENYVQRGNKIYNKQTRSNIFEHKVTMDRLIVGLEWDDLPNLAREYITAVACWEYNKDFLGDDTQKDALQRKIAETQILLESEDVDARNVNVFLNPRVNSIAFKNRRRGV